MLSYYLKNYYGYYILFWMLLILGILGIINRKKQKKYYIIFSLISSFFIIFRFDTEFDYIWYWIIGDNRFKQYWFYQQTYTGIEIFFKIIYSTSRFFESPKFFFISTGLLFSVIFFKSLRRYSNNIFLSLSFYIYLYAIYIAFLIGFIRQGLAIVLSFYLFEKINEKKYLTYFYGIILITIFIHKSAIICLIFIFLKFMEKKRNVIRIFYILLIFVSFRIEWLVNKIGILRKYNFYFNSTTKLENLGIKTITALGFLFLAILVLDFKSKKKDFFLSDILKVGFILYFILIKIKGGHIPQRISIYFLIYFPIYFSSYIYKFKQRKEISIALIVLLFAYGNYQLFKSSISAKKNDNKSRVSGQFKLQFFNDYKDLNGKYIPYTDQEVEYEISDN